MLAANKDYCFLQTTFTSKQIHQNNKIRPQKKNLVSAELWKCNPDPNINDRTYATCI